MDIEVLAFSLASRFPRGLLMPQTSSAVLVFSGMVLKPAP